MDEAPEVAGTLPEGHLEGVEGEVGPQMTRDLPAHDALPEDVPDGGREEPTLPGRDGV